MGKPPTRRNAGDRRWAARMRRARASRRPSDEELIQALALWALIELMPLDGEVGLQARQEVKSLGIDVASKHADIRKLVLKFFAGSRIDPEDVVQETML